MQRQIVVIKKKDEGRSISTNVIMDEYAMIFLNGLLIIENKDYTVDQNSGKFIDIRVSEGDVFQIINPHY